MSRNSAPNRKAMAHLYNRELMLEKFAYNQYVPMKSYFTGIEGENPDNQLVQFNPQKAQELLKEAGWSERGTDGILIKDGKRFSVKMIYRSPVFEKYLTTYQEDCAQVGVELNLELIDSAQLWQRLLDHKFEISSSGLTGSAFPALRSLYHSSKAPIKGTLNFAGHENPELDKLVEAYEVEFDPKKRTELLRKVDAYVFNQHPVVLEWYGPYQRLLYVNKFGKPDYGLPKYADWTTLFETWWVDPDKEEKLVEAKKSGESLPIPPKEIRAWEE